MAVSTLICAIGAAALASAPERGYRARAYVIQVPAALGPERGVELARSDRVLRQAIALSGVDEVSPDQLRRRSSAESTSRLDIAVTVEADRPEQAVELATAYAKAFRRAIPDDVGLGLGTAFALLYEGLTRGSNRAPRRASAPYPRAR